MRPDLHEIIGQFRFEGRFLDALPYGDGHIHDTFAARFELPDGITRRYILQHINQNVFKNPVAVMENIERVTSHIRSKVEASGGDARRSTLTLIPMKEGGYLYHSPDNNYWRAYIFIEGAQTYNKPVSPTHISSAARTFGRFQQSLADFPATKLHETIPNFHNTPKRFEAFLAAVDKDSHNRAVEVKDEIRFAEARAGQAAILTDLLEQSRLPLRITHNDTKLNNVMIDDQTGEGICMIDLDTVMPGLALYDFGDSVRSGATLAAEDEIDLSKVGLSLPTFEQITLGYLEAARDFLTPTELEHLVFSAKLMTFECGLRFLTDYLSGDVYFKIHRPQHNLDRCRSQFKLVSDMEARQDEMDQIVRKYT